MNRGNLCLETDTSASYACFVFTEGDVLRKWRDARRWTVVGLAKRAGVDKNTISRVERGEATRTDTLREIVGALGHTLEELHRVLNHDGELEPSEREHLARWRRLSEEARVRISGVIRLADEYESAMLRTVEPETESRHLSRGGPSSGASGTHSSHGRTKR